MNDAFHGSLLLCSHRNYKPPVTHGDKLILKLSRIGRASKNGFKLLGQSRTRCGECPPDAAQLRAVILIDLAVLNCARQVFAQLPKIRKAVSGSGKLWKCFAFFFPAKAQTLNV